MIITLNLFLNQLVLCLHQVVLVMSQVSFEQKEGDLKGDKSDMLLSGVTIKEI